MLTHSVLGPGVDVRELFERDRSALLRLLRELGPGDWERTTAAAPWLVRDVVAHMLGDDVGRISRTRDGHRVSGPESGEPLAVFLDRFNDEWVRATARVSPPLLADLLEATSGPLLAMWRGADLDAIGEAVSWAGPGPAPGWLDCARDFTEYWVHQQQIREATEKTAAADPEVVRAVLDIFLRAVPYTLERHGDAGPDGSALSIAVPGSEGHTWSWRRMAGAWCWVPPNRDATTMVTADADTLWRLCVRMIEPTEAFDKVRIDGDERLARVALRTVSIIRS